ncbi:MAG: L,D-transpeptidase [Prochlorococcaceae cyanobacterium]
MAPPSTVRRPSIPWLLSTLLGATAFGATAFSATAFSATAGAAALASSEPAPAPEVPAAVTAAAPVPPAVLTREIVLELGRRQISLVEEGKVLGSWPVAIGDPRTPTPSGRFTVENKVVNPIYQSTSSGRVSNAVGPQAPLGDRWIGFKQSGLNQYGIHGTPDAWAWTVTSRAAVSNGCVRMLTPHVRQLFDQVDVGTPVIVKP